MSVSEAKSWTWSRRRWALTVLLVFGTHLGLVFWLSAHRLPKAAPRNRVAVVHWVPDSVVDRSTAGAAAENDPTLFALPGAKGFSAAAWLTLTNFTYLMTNPPPPPRWLLLPVDELADDFNEFVQTNVVAEEIMPEKLVPAPARMDLPLPEVVAETVLKIEGPLSGRRLLKGQPLPRLSQPVLINSVVRARVDRAGRVISAALLSSAGGLSQADQEALKFARSAQFAPAGKTGLSGAESNGLELVWGDLVFQWSRVRWRKAAVQTAQR